MTDTIKHLFKGIYDLSDFKNQEVIDVKEKAIKNPQDYVLKPLKEGGGHNFFDDDIKLMLSTFSQEELAHFLLMEKINAPSIKTYMMINGDIKYCEAITEIGIYSCVIADSIKGLILEN